MLESVEEIRRRFAAWPRRKSRVDVPVAVAPERRRVCDQDTAAYRPTHAAFHGVLHVLDDGEDSGEILRIRPNSFVIGRVEGDLTIPHDGGMSGRHAEIGRRHENGEHCWYLKDLQSTNGTFVRASTVILSHEQEILIGGRRFRFEVPIVPEQPSESEAALTRREVGIACRLAGRVSRTAAVARRGFSGRPGQRFPLRDQEQLAGPRSGSVLDCR